MDSWIQKNGIGELCSPDGVIFDCKFELKQTPAAKIWFYATFDKNDEIAVADKACRLAGIWEIRGDTVDGFSFGRTEVFLRRFIDDWGEGSSLKLIFDSTHLELQKSSTSIHRSEYLITNLLFEGSHKNVLGNGYDCDRIEFTVGGFRCELKKMPDYRETEDLYKEDKRPKVTSKLTIFWNEGQVEKPDGIAQDICWLLTFALGTTIVYISRTDFDGDLQETSIFLIDSRTRDHSGVVWVIPENKLPDKLYLNDFLENSWEGYQTYKDKLHLPLFIQYVNESKCFDLKNMKFLLLVVAAEAIKYYYWNFQDTDRGDPSFLVKLKRTFECFGINGEEFTFKDARNDVVHEGDDKLEFDEFHSEYMKLMDQLHRLFLAICGYRGKYRDVAFGGIKTLNL